MIFLILRSIGSGILGGVLLFAASLLFSRLFFFLLFTGLAFWFVTGRPNTRRDNYVPLQSKRYDAGSERKSLNIVPFNPPVKIKL
ncbi:hypothetical protein DYBT9275_03254 [Dyadobacter sp. CECT 9275]|uniref:Uncharacterized protein n=1 Tax=Dyadobacter helix TaxID=2822344 RepID=A0A916JD41_9BACT|nr:hypothetical protein [Dyadobacter sp. CECT 9275]CAG5003901.1 hypothetical protein DYBT9275_03254 [Dyadobacter sp. CECT 9275]